MAEWVQFMQAKCDKDVVDVLESGGIEPQDIDVIILRFVCCSIRALAHSCIMF